MKDLKLISGRILAIAIATSVLFILSCSHDDTPDGPNLVDRFGPFNVSAPFAASADVVDFEAGESVVFTMEFNKNVDWVIRIQGMESGSVNIIEGFDRTINENNARWTGGTTTLPLFKSEMCMVTVSFPEEPDYADTLFVQIAAPKVYEGIPFTDFEANPGQNIVVGNFEFEFSNLTGRRNGPLTAGQGDWYYFLEGTDNVVPNFFVGLIVINSTITGNTYAPLPTTVPGQLFFNCFIYHDGSPHTIAVIQFATDTNNSGAFEDGQDQTFQVAGDFPLNWVGWRHINHNMASVGMSQAQLEKLVAIRVLLISNNNTQPSPPLPVRFGIDNLTFTQGAPLKL